MSPSRDLPRLHLIDGTYELFRAHFSKRPGHVDPKGRERKATVGIVSSLVTLLSDKDEDVTHLGVAFDNPIRSFRNDLFDGYKTEEGVDPELLAQFDAAEEAVRALGITVWSMDEFEADDAIGTAAVKYRSAFRQMRILSPDKDMGQCLDGQRVVQVDRVREKFIEEKTFEETRGFSPRSIPDFLALVGDTADGIPGLKGFGDKGAAKLLGEFKTLEKLPKDVAAWKATGVRGADTLFATFVEGREDAMLYKKLATLRVDVPLKETPSQLAFEGVPRKAFEKWADAIGASDSLRKRIPRWAEE